MTSSLKIFACDHRNLNGNKWNYPFTRIGTGFNNDCDIKDNDGESICDQKNNKFLSEYTAMWWIWKHLNELGNPKYIGFIHYRRFFSFAKPNFGPYPICQVEHDLTKDNISNVIPNEDTLTNIIDTNNLDGILPCPFPDYTYTNKCRNVIDLMFEESNMIKLGFSYDSCIMMFNILSYHMKQHFNDIDIAKTFECKNTYHFNLFILKHDLFDLYSSILEKTVFDCIDNLNKMSNLNLDPRALAYVIERFSSNIFLALSYQGFKFQHMIMLMVNDKRTL